MRWFAWGIVKAALLPPDWGYERCPSQVRRCIGSEATRQHIQEDANSNGKEISFGGSLGEHCVRITREIAYEQSFFLLMDEEVEARSCRRISAPFSPCRLTYVPIALDSVGKARHVLHLWFAWGSDQRQRLRASTCICNATGCGLSLCICIFSHRVSDLELCIFKSSYCFYQPT